MASPDSAAESPNAAPHFDGGKTAAVIASSCGATSAPPRPCSPRAAISSSALSATAQSSDARTKMLSPTR
jgi:hypothetical protein